MPNKTAIFVGGGVVTVIAVCVTVLAALGKDTTAILVVVNVVVVPLLMALGYQQVKGELSGLRSTTEAVRQQTNGNQTQQLDMMREMVREVMSQQRTNAPERQP